MTPTYPLTFAQWQKSRGIRSWEMVHFSKRMRDIQISFAVSFAPLVESVRYAIEQIHKLELALANDRRH